LVKYIVGHTNSIHWEIADYVGDIAGVLEFLGELESGVIFCDYNTFRVAQFKEALPQLDIRPVLK
jgi:hypothetical protein